MTKRGGKWNRINMTKHTNHRHVKDTDLHRDSRPRQDYTESGNQCGSRILAQPYEPTNCWCG